ncbi:6-bladed beta-propeller [Candidatus Fermentibacterales bacterium]|nr:6-bladed beta-propeller [Candidatus Fermentibacterales bacterium]
MVSQSKLGKWPLILSVTASLMLLYPGCGGEAEQPVEGQGERADLDTGTGASMPEPDRLLVPVDTIGIEIGDSNYVFGQIAAADFLPDGRIGILDMQGCYIGIFSPEGEFLQRIGRQGSGPGEFLLPASFSFFPDGGIIVADAMAGRLSLFDSTFAYEDEITGFFPSPPVGIIAINDGAFVGMKPLFEQNEQGMFMGFEIARYEDSNEPTLVYFSETQPFDPADLAGSFGESIAFFTATQDGRVFVSPMSDDQYVVTCYDDTGAVSFDIEREVERVPKTEEEIREEKTMVEERMIAGGMPPEMANWNPTPYRLTVGGLGVDDQDRLWVVRASYRQPFAEVYEPGGSQVLFTAALDPSMPDAEDLMLLVTPGGIVAMDPNPEDYPRLYLLELR